MRRNCRSSLGASRSGLIHEDRLDLPDYLDHSYIRNNSNNYDSGAQIDMETLGWIVIGWFAVALVVSLALGGFLHGVNAAADEAELEQVTSRRQVLRYMRTHKPAKKPETVIARRETARRFKG
jgi:hypothetical protein